MRLMKQRKRIALPWIGMVCCGILSAAPAVRAETAAQGQGPDQSQIDPLSCGFVPQIVQRGDIQLPVDEWEEAQAIAAEWINAVGDPTLRLGTMRQLGRAYLWTIVDGNDEQMLRHQIVIGVHDGRVAVL